jgi:hypothetical protein
MIPATANHPQVTYDVARVHRHELLRQAGERRRAAAVRASRRQQGSTVDPPGVWRWLRESLLRRGLAQAGR